MTSSSRDRRFTLSDPPFANRTGRGVIVAVLDSGVHADHPHVGGVQGGVSLVPTSDSTGESTSDSIDRIGHGTAVAAAIREKAPDSELIAIKIFDRQLATNVDVLGRAIVWAAEHGAQLINLSLGTANAAHAERLALAVDVASRHHAVIVSALASNDVEWFPGSLAGVVGVVADSSSGRDVIALSTRADALPVFTASPFPRPIPGVPRERNLAGVSFAVANVTGFLARAMEQRARGDEWGWLSSSTDGV